MMGAFHLMADPEGGEFERRNCAADLDRILNTPPSLESLELVTEFFTRWGEGLREVLAEFAANAAEEDDEQYPDENEEEGD